MRSRPDAHARTPRRMAHLAAAWRYRSAGEARTPGLGGSGRAGRRAPGKDRNRPRLRLRKKLRAELSVAGSLSGVAVAWISLVSRNVKKVFSRTHVGEGWKRRSG